jgi:esterase/lipase superfamily enzyme
LSRLARTGLVAPGTVAPGAQCIEGIARLTDVSRFRVAASVGLALLCCACSALPMSGPISGPTSGALVPYGQAVEQTSRVNILVATTRDRIPESSGAMFGSGRALDVSYAALTISIPPDEARTIGEVQWPTLQPGNPQRDFVTLSADYINKQSFDAAVSSAAKRTHGGKVLVFVHGFNNRFDAAVYRFAQIVHDANASVVPVLFSWPSRGQALLSAYTYDMQSANYSRDALESLLDSLAHNPDVKEVTLLAHSMGNWIALEALRAKSIHAGKIGDKISSVLLVAPDVDVDVFRMQIQRMGTSRPRFALFLSQDDGALKISQSIWGGVSRIGAANPNIPPYRDELDREGIVVFDLTNMQGGAHSRAFTDITSVTEMMRQRFANGQKMTDPEFTLSGVIH